MPPPLYEATGACGGQHVITTVERSGCWIAAYNVYMYSCIWEWHSFQQVDERISQQLSTEHSQSRMVNKIYALRAKEQMLNNLFISPYTLWVAICMYHDGTLFDFSQGLDIRYVSKYPGMNMEISGGIQKLCV